MSVRHVMVDIETLGTSPGSVILSVGAVTFSDDGVSPFGFDRTISVFDSLMHGLRVEPATVEWWRSQSREVRGFAHGNADLGEVLRDFARYLDQRETRLWAKGPDFDLVLLDSAYQAAGVKRPWHYRDTRDVRTILALAPKAERAEATTKHYAIDDAEAQARNVIAAYHVLGLRLDGETRA